MVSAIYWLITTVLSLLIWAIIIAAVLSMLVGFGVVNRRNQFVYTFGDFLNRVTDPMLRPIRRVVPYFGNVDISPIIAILILGALKMVVADIYWRLLTAGLAF